MFRSKTIFPIRELLATEALGGFVTLGVAGVAMLLANSAFGPSYAQLATQARPWVNEGLMVVFFFMVSLEIKREWGKGTMGSKRQAILPVAAALGGMVVPACVYLLLNPGHPARSGWGIPMATDIALAMAVLSLLGKRVTQRARLQLVSLAIADDLGAILVIALFYSSVTVSMWLGVSLLLTAAMFFPRDSRPMVWLNVGMGCLLAVSLYLGHLHPTLAGVVTAFSLPSQSKDGWNAVESFERWIQRPVSLAIMPAFALANAGLVLKLPQIGTLPVTLGVALGLCVGKPLGIVTFWRAAERYLNLAKTAGSVLGIGLMGGIGFTMSLFINSVAFTDEALAGAAKLGILMGSLVSAALGLAVLSRSREG